MRLGAEGVRGGPARVRVRVARLDVVRVVLGRVRALRVHLVLQLVHRGGDKRGFTVRRRAAFLPPTMSEPTGQSTQPATSSYMPQRADMEYLCAGTCSIRHAHGLVAQVSCARSQTVAPKTRSRRASPSAVESAVTASCTRSAQSEVRGRSSSVADSQCLARSGAIRGAVAWHPLVLCTAHTDKPL